MQKQNPPKYPSKRTWEVKQQGFWAWCAYNSAGSPRTQHSRCDTVWLRAHTHCDFDQFSSQIILATQNRRDQGHFFHLTWLKGTAKLWPQTCTQHDAATRGWNPQLEVPGCAGCGGWGRWQREIGERVLRRFCKSVSISLREELKPNSQFFQNNNKKKSDKH